MKRFLGVLIILFSIGAFDASADVLIEPLVGYSFGLSGEVKEATVSGLGTLSKNEFKGGGGGSFGGRLGYQKLGFQFGLDYLHSSINPSDKDFKGNLAMDEWAAFAGFEFPVLLRVYAGYIFSANGSGKYDNGTSVEKITMSDGSGYKAGIGFTVLPFLDINFEYRHGTFSKWKTGSVKVDGDIDYNAYMVGVSLPFTI